MKLNELYVQIVDLIIAGYGESDVKHISQDEKVSEVASIFVDRDTSPDYNYVVEQVYLK